LCGMWSSSAGSCTGVEARFVKWVAPR
jgi:hypothetical protein